MSAAEAFFQGNENRLMCWRALERALLERYPMATVRVQKTCLSFMDSRPFCYVSQPRYRGTCMVISFGLDAPLADVRIRCAVEAQPNRWTHHVDISSPEEIDGQLLFWLELAHRMKKKGERK